VSLQSKITTCCRGSALGQTHRQIIEEWGFFVWVFFWLVGFAFNLEIAEIL